MTGVPLTPCERNSADIVGQPQPADERRSAEVGYFLLPWACGSIRVTRREALLRHHQSNRAVDRAVLPFAFARHDDAPL